MPDSRKPEDGADRNGASPTAAQLRSEIDSGQARDKVAYSDPAAAPLGTDDEAAGSPPTGEQVRAARRYETGREGADPGAAARPPGGAAAGNRMAWLIAAAVALAAVVAIAFAI